MNPAALTLVLFAVPAAADPLYTPEGGRYSVRFPGSPKEHTQASATAVGEVRTHTATFAQPDGTVLAIAYTDYPPAAARNPDALLLGGRDGLKGKHGSLLADAPDPFGPGKLPSRSVIVDTNKSVVRARLVVKGGRLYQVTAVGTKEVVTGPAVDAFFESFTIGE